MKNEKIEKLFSRISTTSTAESFLDRRIEFKESKTYRSNGHKEESKFSTPYEKDKQKVLYSALAVETALLGWKRISPIGGGFANLGNTCFLNSVLQCLTYTSPLVNFLLSKEHSQRCRITGFCAFCELERLIPQAFSSNKSVAYPKNIAYNIKAIGKQFRHGRQEDAHEFLRYLIDSLQKSFLASCNAQGADFKVKETSLLYQIYSGLFESSVTCLSCKHVSRTTETWLDISLEIKNADSIEKALRHFTSAERLSSANKYKCDSCHSHVEATKRILLQRLPPIVTIHLKRFTVTHKVGKFVSFPQTLDMRAFCTAQCSAGASSLYELYAVLVHQGNSCGSGHYYAFVKASNGCWYLMNDSCVSQVSIDTVLKQHAYILFYSKKVNAPVGEKRLLPSDEEQNQQVSAKDQDKQREKKLNRIDEFVGTCMWNVECI